MITHVRNAFCPTSTIKTIKRAEDLLGHDIQHRRGPNAQLTSGIPGVAMKHYKALYSTVAPYHGSLVI